MSQSKPPGIMVHGSLQQPRAACSSSLLQQLQLQRHQQLRRRQGQQQPQQRLQWLQQLLQRQQQRQQQTMEVTAAAKSGDGTVINVGIKMDGGYQRPDCRQKFETEKAKQLHWKFIHDPNRHQED